MERVIFRKQYNPYTKEWGFLAAFPDDDCSVGMISGVSFTFDRDGKAVFEPYTDYSLPYYYAKKIVRRKDPMMGKLRKAVEDYYGTKFRVCEKVIA